MPKLINLTPHDINVAGANGDIVTIPTSGMVARRDEQHLPANPLTVNGVQLATVVPKFGDTYCVGASGEKLPFPQPVDGTFLIVSMQVQLAFPLRQDVVTVFKFDRERGCAVGFCRNS